MRHRMTLRNAKEEFPPLLMHAFLCFALVFKKYKIKNSRTAGHVTLSCLPSCHRGRKGKIHRSRR